MGVLSGAAARLEREAEEAAKKRRWLEQPATWIKDRLGEHIWSKQIEIADSVRDHRLTAVKSCHGSGKSFTASRLTAWWLDTHPPGEARVVTTAPTGDQVRAILWTEINGAVMKAAARGNPFPGRVNETDWKLGKQLIAFGRKPSDYNPHAFQGIHAKFVLVILDEACGINKQFWTAANSIATGEHCRILAIGNPDDPSSHFARVCASERWNTIRISAFDTPNFTDEDVPEDLRPNLVSHAYVEEMAEDYGVESPTYISKVTGDFPSDSEDGVVQLSKVRACSSPEPTPRAADQLVPIELGVDLGAGGDETCIRERRGMVVGREWRTRTRESAHAVGLVMQAIEETKATAVKVDVIGIGWGVVGRLQELRSEGKHKAAIYGVNVAEASAKPEKYSRLRSQLWWEIGRQLSESRGWDFSHLEEKDRERLVSQLTAPKYTLDSSGRITVEKKDETKKRLGRSPDNADALLLAFYVESGPRVRWI
ncbi:terminase large subunit domain-containing protein [Lentzea sp. NPDC092896]|uniref:terminase large subunit domain-containing protein n=1 Tax=Lentzea sp. NPDC092896 TaxID=3364127 RepID=UPI0037FEB3E1